MHWQRRASLGISVLFIAFGSCFEAPIREELRLRFLPNGGGAALRLISIALIVLGVIGLRMAERG
jgi:hypothetical protein